MTELVKALTALVAALSWPLLVLFIAIYFGKPLKEFLNNVGKLSGKAGPSGIEWTAERVVAATTAGVALAAAAAKGGVEEVQDPAAPVVAVAAILWCIYG